MKKINYDKTHRGPTLITVLGITALALLMLVSVVATVDTVVAAGTECKEVKDNIPNYTGGAVLNIINGIESDMLVVWTKADSKKPVFKVNIPTGQTRTVETPSYYCDEYIRTGCLWYRVIPDSNSGMSKDGHILLKSGYIYTIKYYWVEVPNVQIYDGSGFKRIPDSQAPEV